MESSRTSNEVQITKDEEISLPSTPKMTTVIEPNETESPLTTQFSQSSITSSSWNPLTSNNPTNPTSTVGTTTISDLTIDPEPKSSFPTYLIVVISVAGVLAIAGIAGIVFYFYKKSKQSAQVIPTNNTDFSTSYV